MEAFDANWAALWSAFGPARKMVLATTAGEQVSARMMSLVRQGERLYFQTDCTSRKYAQLCANPHIALCADNLQIEGICRELGHPLEHPAFPGLFQAAFPDSFARYTHLTDERLFEVTPLFAKRWLYRDGIPFEEIFEPDRRWYALREYQGK